MNYPGEMFGRFYLVTLEDGSRVTMDPEHAAEHELTQWAKRRPGRSFGPVLWRGDWECYLRDSFGTSRIAAPTKDVLHRSVILWCQTMWFRDNFVYLPTARDRLDAQ